MINTKKLSEELQISGILFSGCNSNGIVWDIDGMTEIQDREDVAAVIAAHDPTPEPESEIVEFEKPVKAPDFLIASPEKEEDAKAARDKIREEMGKAHGIRKSLGVTLVNLPQVLDDLYDKIAAQQTEIDKLKNKKQT